MHSREPFENPHPDAQWWPDAGLGLFIHWDMTSVDATVEMGFGPMQGKSWGGLEEGDDVVEELIDTAISPEEYWELAERFDPDAFDPDRWLSAAGEAGFEYAVLTAKHLAGYTLWPSEYTEFGVQEHLDDRDLVGEYIDACRRHGLRAGLYFCMGDIHHPAFPGRDDVDQYDFESFTSYLNEPQPITDQEVRSFENYVTDVRGQIHELLTRYGDLDVLWLDVPTWLGGANINRGLNELYDMVRNTQPDVVLGREYPGGGDFRTPENELPENPLEGWWELCQVWAPPNWCYHQDESYRDMKWTHERLARTVSRGGNLLLNVGPKANGELPAEAYERMDSLADWMAHSEPAVKGVDPGPWPPRADVPITRRSGIWYVHVLSSHSGPIEIEDVPEPAGLTHLRTTDPIDYRYENDTVEFELPGEKRTCGNEVVALTWRTHSPS